MEAQKIAAEFAAYVWIENMGNQERTEQEKNQFAR